MPMLAPFLGLFALVFSGLLGRRIEKPENHLPQRLYALVCFNNAVSTFSTLSSPLGSLSADLRRRHFIRYLQHGLRRGGVQIAAWTNQSDSNQRYQSGSGSVSPSFSPGTPRYWKSRGPEAGCTGMPCGRVPKRYPATTTGGQVGAAASRAVGLWATKRRWQRQQHVVSASAVDETIGGVMAGRAGGQCL